MYAGLTMENLALKELIGKKAPVPMERREAADWLVSQQNMAASRRCLPPPGAPALRWMKNHGRTRRLSTAIAFARV
jgi:hypothetical protein